MHRSPIRYDLFRRVRLLAENLGERLRDRELSKVFVNCLAVDAL